MTKHSIDPLPAPHCIPMGTSVHSDSSVFQLPKMPHLPKYNFYSCSWDFHPPISIILFYLKIFFLILLIYFWLHLIFAAARALSLVVGSRGYSLVGVPGHLIAGASFVEYRVPKLESSSSSQKLEKARAQQQRPSTVTKINE